MINTSYLIAQANPPGVPSSGGPAVINQPSSGIVNSALSQFGSGDGGVALGQLMATLFRVCIGVGGLALLLYLMSGGLHWIMAGGDKGKVEEAKSTITNAIIGMAALVAVVAIASYMGTVLGLDLLNPTL